MQDFKIVSNGATVTVDLAAMPASIVDKVIQYGIKQKVADAASDALAQAFDAHAGEHGLEGDALKAARKAFKAEHSEKVTEMAEALMTVAIDRLLAGDWGSERTGSAGADPLDKHRKAVVLAWFRAKPESEAAIAYAKIPAKEQAARHAFALAVAAENAKQVDPRAQALLDAESVAFDLDM